ncbi:hypothetical protein SLV14_006881 [Streptomyces sp. Je 1-4]|nr:MULTISPECIES: hypothetical protein [unclassified Streptomyces]QIK04698.1 hypothetical protein G7Z12_32575 [Streptomyces sp. ID38640]UYB45119.1 hypothetical protein SLV14_006881 [Streptomyces sp. Je 1-4]UZQ40268.1 hypothetical protein SLV14N_006881 [Streptomyces sp. Je 1-4] [Streptomyces sp. Je 1-4 4N24]UZQ47685.1 hypothetical protein SLV14NA_006881 [Streptomyces sp. Je 1-4] [Streptomyces sp. Je 1-4 4N24_ara]
MSRPTQGGAVHVGFESWRERDRLLLMDFDPSVGGDGLAAVLAALA